MSRNVLMLAVAGTLLIASGSAAAATRTTTFEAKATVNANCLVSATALDFLGYDGTTAKTANSDISVRCSKGTGFVVALSTGTSGGTYAQRLLSDVNSNKLQYNLYTATGASAPIWGDPSDSSTATMSGTGQGMSTTNAQPFTVYGVLPNSVDNQNAPAGVYTDIITVTVIY
jgi:spore coat protein U-like protein